MYSKPILAVVAIILLFTSCANPQVKLGEEILLQETLPYNAPYHIEGVDIYKAVNYNDSKNKSLDILDASSERILYAIQNKNVNQDKLGEGITAQTQEIGIYRSDTDTVEMKVIPEKAVYIYDGELQSDGFVYLHINLDGKNDKYTFSCNGADGVRVLGAGENGFFFNAWPYLSTLDDGKVILLEPLIDNPNKIYANSYQYNGLQAEIVPNMFSRDYSLLDSKMLGSGEHLATLWNKNETLHLIISNGAKVKYDIPITSKYKMVNYSISHDGIILSLQYKDRAGSLLQFIRFSDMRPISVPFIDMYRMTGEHQQRTIMGVDLNFNPYIINVSDDTIQQTAVDISDWHDGYYAGPILITATEANKFLLNLQTKNNVLMVTID